MTYRYAAGSRAELLVLADWFEARRPGAGDAFATDMEGLIQRLLVFPRMYAREPRSPRGREFRIGLTSSYPAVVMYEVTPTEIIILSVTHARAKRRPWRRRI
jgi:plasmid stabilization system protein ParE